MLTSGFTHAPVSRVLLFSVVASSILASITESKHLFYILVEPHLWRYKQAWRILIWQASFANSTDVLFAALALYNLRVIERLWGSRKFLSFILSIYPYTTLLTPFLLAVLLRPLSFGQFNYLPAGPTPVVFALLAQYHAAIPRVYQYKVVTSLSEPPPEEDPPGFTLSDKFTTYLVAGQVALAQLPGSALAAAVGWVIGYAWRLELLPGAAKWRVPGWLAAAGASADGERHDGLRRRLEGESAAAAAATTNRGHASSIELGTGDDPQRRTLR